MKTESTTNKDLLLTLPFPIELDNALQNLTVELDDVKNRSMRGNLIFYAIPEIETEGTTTKDLLADFLVYHLGVPNRERALTYLVRVHRSRRNNNEGEQQQNKARPIYVKFSRDDTAEFFLRASITEKVTSKGFKVTKQFTKELQERRNKALVRRRQMIDNGEITKGFVDYPAVLKGLRVGMKHYTTIEKF